LRLTPAVSNRINITNSVNSYSRFLISYLPNIDNESCSNQMVWKYSEVMEINQITPPNLSTGKVLVEVEVAGINPIDWKIRKGYM
jgi:hypothetical protein